MTLDIQPDRPRERHRHVVVRCEDCGLTLHGGAIWHDAALVLASICPRCDGTLSDAPPAAPDPSIYLG